jgi:hypothetical protein
MNFYKTGYRKMDENNIFPAKHQGLVPHLESIILYDEKTTFPLLEHVVYTVWRTALDIFVVICFVMVFLAFVEFAFISFVGIFISRMKYRDFVRVRTLRQMTRYMYSIYQDAVKKTFRYSRPQPGCH